MIGRGGLHQISSSRNRYACQGRSTSYIGLTALIAIKVAAFKAGIPKGCDMLGEFNSKINAAFMHVHNTTGGSMSNSVNCTRRLRAPLLLT